MDDTEKATQRVRRALDVRPDETVRLKLSDERERLVERYLRYLITTHRAGEKRYTPQTTSSGPPTMTRRFVFDSTAARDRVDTS